MRKVLQVKQTLLSLRQDKFFRIIAIILGIILFGALAIYFADHYYTRKGIGGFFDAVWWAVVTITTVGYGDIVPVSVTGKVAGLFIILSGPALLSLVTASVASILVEKKIKEGKGLKTITDRGHIIICGWNEMGTNVIDGILARSKGLPAVIVLVNELDRDEVQSIQYKYQDQPVRFVRGNFAREDVLARANLARAKAAVVLADISGGHTLENADERTIFGVMAIKTMASKVRTCAELIHAENREHLVRANVDEAFVRGGSAGYMLAKAAMAPGIMDAIELMIGDQDENKLWRIPIPSKYVQKPLKMFSVHLREKWNALILAVIKEERGISLDDILSGDATTIDEFIKRKFEASGRDFFGARKNISIMLNPPEDYEPAVHDWILVISKEKP